MSVFFFFALFLSLPFVAFVRLPSTLLSPLECKFWCRLCTFVLCLSIYIFLPLLKKKKKEKRGTHQRQKRKEREKTERKRENCLSTREVFSFFSFLLLHENLPPLSFFFFLYFCRPLPSLSLLKSSLLPAIACSLYFSFFFFSFLTFGKSISLS